MAWEFSRACHDADTIRRVAQAYVAALETLVAGHAVPSAPSRPATGLPQAPASVRPDEIADVYPLTPTQQGMLFHSLYAPASDAYFSSLNFRIDGALDVERFRRAWETVAHRHDILRTAFHWEDIEARAGRASPDRLAVARRGSAASAAEAEQRWEAYVAQDRARGFDFARAPLMRLALFRAGEHAWRFH